MAEKLTDQELRELIALGEKATERPWRWNVNLKSPQIVLESAGRGSKFEYIMDFARWGMQGATPRFRTEDDLMENAASWAVKVEGREHHADWYRTLHHPDARFIAASANAAVALATELLVLRAANLRLQHWADLAIADMQDRIARGELFDPEHVKQAEADIAAGRFVKWEDLKEEIRANAETAEIARLRAEVERLKAEAENHGEAWRALTDHADGLRSDLARLRPVVDAAKACVAQLVVRPHRMKEPIEALADALARLSPPAQADEKEPT